MLFAYRVDQPRLPKYVLANLQQIAALYLRVQALRLDVRHAEQDPGGWAPVVLPLVPIGLLVPLSWWSQDSMYLVVLNLVGLSFGVWLMHTVWQAGKIGP